MAIGTEVKVGWDASAVKSGLTWLQGAFKGTAGKVAGGLKGLAAGGSKIGATLTGLLAEGAIAWPKQIESLRELSNQYGNLSRSAGATFKEIGQLSKALELSGMEADMSGELIREFSTKMGEAIKEPGEIRDALHDLGFNMPEFKGLGVVDQMRAFAKGVKDFKGTSQDLYYIFDRFLGGDLGLKSVGFFMDYDRWLGEAAQSSDAFSEALERQRENLQLNKRLGDAIRRKFSEGVLMSLEGGESGGLADLMKDVIKRVEGMDSSALGRAFGKAGAEVHKLFTSVVDSIGSKGLMATLKEKLTELGQYLKSIIRDAVAGGIGEALNPRKIFMNSLGFGSSGGGIGDMVKPAAPKSAEPNLSEYIKRLISVEQSSNKTLQNIERNGFQSVFE